jgi:methylmalonyl-CoA mutase N-terminal domain/subunit
MSTGLEKIAEAYFKGAAKTHSPCGIDLKHVYKPEDTKDLNYEKDLGDPGHYPFTRGVYEDMYRGRLFSMRLITGCPTPKLTNDRFRLLLAEGESAINIIGDAPTMIGIDPDHPRAEGGVGLTGVPIARYKDMDTILDGLPVDQISTMLSLGTPIAMPSYLCVAEDRNIPFSALRGTNPLMGPGLYAPVCNYAGKEWYEALLLGPEAFFDTLKWCETNAPKFNPTNFNCYNIREQGVNAAQEIAYVLAQCFETLNKAEELGADKELVARKFSFTANGQINIFEEVAKFRAARRIFAQTLRDRFKIQNPKSLRMKIHVNTGGSLMEHPQAKINIIRGAYAALAAVLGGIQSLQIASYDEPIAIPTDEAATMALRTEQILAHETGVTSVVDPLAGSYYVETLTNKMELEIRKIIEEIESQGGLTKVIRTGWLDQQMEREFLRRQQEMETRERIVVGVNDYVVPSEEDDMVPNYEVDRVAVNAYVNEIREFKKSRDMKPLKESLETLRNLLAEGKKTPIPYIMKALRAGATTGEVMGMYRMAHGYLYDPWDEVPCPF